MLNIKYITARCLLLVVAWQILILGLSPVAWTAGDTQQVNSGSAPQSGSMNSIHHRKVTEAVNFIYEEDGGDDASHDGTGEKNAQDNLFYETILKPSVAIYSINMKPGAALDFSHRILKGYFNIISPPPEI